MTMDDLRARFDSVVEQYQPHAELFVKQILEAAEDARKSGLPRDEAREVLHSALDVFFTSIDAVAKATTADILEKQNG